VGAPTIHIPEIILREIWRRQQFTASHLHTSDGKPVHILSPGISNSDGGPDFLNARIRIGRTTYRGDVELHKDASEWQLHRHDNDPHYNRVILHVVLTADTLSPRSHTASRRDIPLLVLHPYLDPKTDESVARYLSDETRETSKRIPCHNLNNAVPAEVIIRWIEHLGLARIELKLRRFEERLKQLVDEQRFTIREPYPRYYGNPDEIPLPDKEYTKRDFTSRLLWEQLLYEGIMEAMGYSKNRTPFLTLAQSIHLEFLRKHNLQNTPAMMSILFGAAGLLPSERTVVERESKRYLRQLKSLWKHIKPQVRTPFLHEADWLFFRLRPVNFPTARLAAMCFILPKLFSEESFRQIISTIKRENLTAGEKLHTLADFFRVEPDVFWQHHYHFKGNSGKYGIALGPDRVREILVNVIIPITLLYARIFKEPQTRSGAVHMLSSLQSSQPNAVTDIIEKQLVRAKTGLSTTVRQQGAIHLYSFYCSKHQCGECDIGRFIGLR
jgi:hypothetical protein